MKTRGTGRKKRREGLGNRLAIIGITVVVLSLAVVVNVKNTSKNHVCFIQSAIK